MDETAAFAAAAQQAFEENGSRGMASLENELKQALMRCFLSFAGKIFPPVYGAV
jgi:hypothetical protein